jgi:hypothetical protein
MTKVTIDYEDSNMLGQLFQDSITHCLLSKQNMMCENNREGDVSAASVARLDSMINFYDEKIAAYEKMRDSLTWKSKRKEAAAYKAASL